MRPRALRVGVADDDHLLAAVALGLPPETAVVGHVRRIEALRDDSLHVDVTGAFEEILAVADIVIAVADELGGPGDEVTEPLLARAQRPLPEVDAVEIEQVECEMD